MSDHRETEFHKESASGKGGTDQRLDGPAASAGRPPLWFTPLPKRGDEMVTNDLVNRLRDELGV